MTQEEKAKAYDKALEIAKAWCKLDNNDLSNEDLETLFPELKESEDERIRKEIINYIKTGTYHKDWIAWLEKQGKQKHAKSIVETWKDMRLEVYQQASGNRHEPNYSDDTTKMFSLNNIDEIIEKMSEQNHADKVEHKFKVGDEIKTTNEEPLTITKIDEKGYWSEDLFICGFDDAAKWELVEHSKFVFFFRFELVILINDSLNVMKEQ